MEAAPYDNVEFGPLQRKTGTWPGPPGPPTPPTLLTQPQSRPLHSPSAKGAGVTSRLAPLEESSAEVAESRDQRMQATTQHASSSFASSSASQGQRATAGFPMLGSGSGSSGSVGQGLAGASSGAKNSVLTMAATTTATTTTVSTITPATVLSKTATSANNSSVKSTTATEKNALPKTNAAAPTYVLTQVGSGGPKEAAGLRSGDDDEDFKRHDLDPASRAVLEAAYTHHKEFYRLNSKVLDEGALLKQDVLDIYRKAGEAFSYEQLLQGMLEDGEMLLLGGCWLHYVHVEFKDETGDQTLRQPYGRGRLCLTNNRVLLLSADVYTDANLEPYGSVKKDGGYKLEVSKRNSVVFRNLPLACFHSADMEVHIGTSAQTKITSRPNPCCCLCPCFACGCCSARWVSTPPMTRSFNERVVRMGVALPPWGQRVTVLLHLDPGQSLTTARDFVAQLHQHSPNLH